MILLVKRDKEQRGTVCGEMFGLLASKGQASENDEYVIATTGSRVEVGEHDYRFFHGASEITTYS